MKKILILALLLFLVVDVWLFFFLFKPNIPKISFKKSFKADQVIAEYLPINKSLIYLPGNTREFSSPTVKLGGVVKKVTVHGGKLYLELRLEKDSVTSTLSIFAIEPLLTLRANKGELPLTQEWKGEGFSDLKKSIKVNDPVIVEIPYVTSSDVRQLQKSVCPTEYCKLYLKLMENAQVTNKKVIDEWVSTSTFDSNNVVGPLSSLILYE